MALEFNVEEFEFFLGEDKVISVPIFGEDGETVLDVSDWTFEYTIRKKEGSEEFLIQKKSTLPGPTITVTGIWNVNKELNTQRVNIHFVSNDTDPITGPVRAQVYPHALKRTDPTFENVLFYGTVHFSIATTH